jgi:hypothetical protein
VVYSEIEKLMNTLVNSQKSPGSRDSVKSDDPVKPALNDSVELTSEELEKYTADLRAPDPRPLFSSSKSKMFESIVDISIDWSNFQELKLILFSIEFGTKNTIRFSEVEKRRDC